MDCEDLLLLYDEKCMNDEELLMLYDINSSKNLEIPYWRCERFNLEKYGNDECLYDLADALNLPRLFVCSGWY